MRALRDVLTVCVLASAPVSWAWAQGSVDHSAHGGGQQAGASASTAAYRADMAKMHKDMDIEYSGDADVDFARGMIPHHRGAIDMAQTQLKFGKDPELRKLAQEVVDAQEKEIEFLEQWLAKKAG